MSMSTSKTRWLIKDKVEYSESHLNSDITTHVTVQIDLRPNTTGIDLSCISLSLLCRLLAICFLLLFLMSSSS